MATQVCTQHVRHCMTGHYYYFLRNLSALYTFACNVLIINAEESVHNLHFYLHYHLHHSKQRCVCEGNGRAGKQQREGEKTVGATYFPTSRYSKSAILAHKLHNPVHLWRTALAHNLQCRQSADMPTLRKCLITNDLEPISAECRHFSK